MKISVLTLGCKVNQAEMSQIEGSLKGQGHDIVSLSEGPDICVVNTCTVTAKSDYQSRQLIRRAGRTGARVIVTGCYSELNKDAAGRMEGVHTVVDNADKDSIINLIGGNRQSDALGVSGGRTRFFLKVQDGCNNSCTYCIVHIARGASRSVSPEKTIEEVNRAVEGGFKEVVLTGVHLGQYGLDLGSGVSLTSLVEEILQKTSLERLRLSSLEVNEIDEGLLGLLESPRLMPHLHIPLQSGDDGVLKLMNRHYDTASFRDAVMRVHARFPGIALGTDIIAGFPQETEDAFNNTVKLAGELPFTYMHVFPYSRRPGTMAAEMEDIVGGKTRDERASALRALAQKKKSLYMNRQVGQTLDVLVEESPKEGECRGTSGNYLKVRVLLSGNTRGTVVPVRIAGHRDGVLSGEAEENR
jgi:threonylcarbamoyladenosine tRNA methylthiotransferase MtaB